MLNAEQDYYHGGKYNFLRWAGFNLTQAKDSNNPAIQQFYTDSTIVATFKDYIKTLLTHKNQYNNLTYAEEYDIYFRLPFSFHWHPLHLYTRSCVGFLGLDNSH
jgi:hypothetical protein